MPTKYMSSRTDTSRTVSKLVFIMTLPLICDDVKLEFIFMYLINVDGFKKRSKINKKGCEKKFNKCF